MKTEDIHIKEILSKIQEELSVSLSKIPLNFDSVQKFPIEFENDLGKWKIFEGGKVLLQPKEVAKYIELKLTITPTGELSNSDSINIEGFEIKKEWMNDPDFPDPPDEKEVPSQESGNQWEAYKKALKLFYNKKNKHNGKLKNGS